jgi:hypothetical protein
VENRTQVSPDQRAAIEEAMVRWLSNNQHCMKSHLSRSCTYGQNM